MCIPSGDLLVVGEVEPPSEGLGAFALADVVGGEAALLAVLYVVGTPVVGLGLEKLLRFDDEAPARYIWSGLGSRRKSPSFGLRDGRGYHLRPGRGRFPPVRCVYPVLVGRDEPGAGLPLPAEIPNHRNDRPVSVEGEYHPRLVTRCGVGVDGAALEDGGQVFHHVLALGLVLPYDLREAEAAGEPTPRVALAAPGDGDLANALAEGRLLDDALADGHEGIDGPLRLVLGNCPFLAEFPLVEDPLRDGHGALVEHHVVEALVSLAPGEEGDGVLVAVETDRVEEARGGLGAPKSHLDVIV